MENHKKEGIEKKRVSIKEMITNKDELVILAEKEGRTIGFISDFIRKREDYTPKILGQIGEIHVIKPFRRQESEKDFLKNYLHSSKNKMLKR